MCANIHFYLHSFSIPIRFLEALNKYILFRKTKHLSLQVFLPVLSSDGNALLQCKYMHIKSTMFYTPHQPEERRKKEFIRPVKSSSKIRRQNTCQAFRKQQIQTNKRHRTTGHSLYPQQSPLKPKEISVGFSFFPAFSYLCPIKN